MSTELAAQAPERCPGYTCEPGRTWTEAHRDTPGDPGFPPGHFWHSQGGHSYMAHVPDFAFVIKAETLADVPAPPAAVDLDDTAAHWYQAAVTARAEIDRHTEIYARAVAHVQAAMGDASEARISGVKVATWAPAKPRMILSREAAEAEVGKDKVAGWLRPSKPSRPFRITGGA